MSLAFPDLLLGMRSPEVGNLQRYLVALGYVDWTGASLAPDEDFGKKTSYALRQWQTRKALSPTGVFGERERDVALCLDQAEPFLPFIQAKSCTLLGKGTSRAVRVLVLHTMENQEKPESADNVALWFAGRSVYPAPKASAHYAIDQDSTIQCVRDSDVAWHAPGVNNDGIGIEHAGTAKQTAAEWEDAPSRAILWRSAKLAARLARTYDIPVVKLTPEELLAGKRGLCGHNDATLAYPGPGRTHWDPGPSFPWKSYLQLIETASRVTP